MILRKNYFRAECAYNINVLSELVYEVLGTVSGETVRRHSSDNCERIIYFLSFDLKYETQEKRFTKSHKASE